MISNLPIRTEVASILFADWSYSSIRVGRILSKMRFCPNNQCQVISWDALVRNQKYFWIWLMFSWGARHFYVSCSILTGPKWPPIKKRNSYKSLWNWKILKSFGMHFFDPRHIKASRKLKRNPSRISVYFIKGNILTWLFRLCQGFRTFKLNSNT